MVPDYRLIAEICLFSFGYSTAKYVSKRMTATFSLSSEQLSSQDHYDFGMRAVKSVINAAGILKRDQPTTNEDTLVYRALMDVNKPKFLVEDLVLFSGIMSDLFLGVEKPVINYGRLMDAMNSSCGNLNLQNDQSFLDKIIQLYDTTVVRHGLMLVGPTGGGKTVNYRTLAASQSLCKDQFDMCAAITAMGTTPAQAYQKIVDVEPTLNAVVFNNFITVTLASQWPEDKKWDKQALQRLFRYINVGANGEISKDEFVAGATTIEGAEFQRVQYYCLNPKSISSGQLYGDFDENTHEWTDGILAVCPSQFPCHVVRFKHGNDSCRACKCVMSLMCMSQIAQIKVSCHKYARVLLHIYNESCLACERVSLPLCRKLYIPTPNPWSIPQTHPCLFR